MDNQTNRNNQTEIEFNVAEFLFDLLAKWWLILLAAVICGSGMFVYTKIMVTPMYRSTAKLYVLPVTEDKSLTASDAQMALSFTKDFQAIATGRTTLNGVIENLGLNMRYESLAGMVSSSSSEDSRIISISVSHPDPIEAQRLADAICVEAEEVLYSTVESDLVNISEKAYLPLSPYSPNMTKNVTVGAAAGVFIVCLLMFIIHIADDKLKTPSDIESYLGLSTLGAIPLAKPDSKKKKYHPYEYSPHK